MADAIDNGVPMETMSLNISGFGTAVDALMAKGFRFVTVEELFLLRGIKAEAGCEYRSLPPEQD